jgi:hypothetical protein
LPELATWSIGNITKSLGIDATLPLALLSPRGEMMVVAWGNGYIGYLPLPKDWEQ